MLTQMLNFYFTQNGGPVGRTPAALSGSSGFSKSSSGFRSSSRPAPVYNKPSPAYNRPAFKPAPQTAFKPAPAQSRPISRPVQKPVTRSVTQGARADPSRLLTA